VAFDKSREGIVKGQSDLFDPLSLAEGERRRDIGMRAVTAHTPASWRAAFDAAVSRLLHQGHRRLTSEDVLALIGLPPADVHPNAIGANMRAAAVRHGLRNVGTVKAARIARHAGRITVWERL
jgi:hypothetical protein